MNVSRSEKRPIPVSPLGIAEQVFVAFCFATLLILPPILVEGMPLSTAPMFAVRHHELHFYSLTDRDGKELNRDLYGLRNNVNAYLEQFYGVKYPKNLVNPIDRDPDIERVIRNIRIRGNRNGAAFPLRLTSRVFGPINDQTVGLIRSGSWVITADGAN